MYEDIFKVEMIDGIKETIIDMIKLGILYDEVSFSNYVPTAPTFMLCKVGQDLIDYVEKDLLVNF